jgi:hypothetical protein
MEGAGKLWLRHIINDLGGSDEPVGFGSRVGRVHRRFLLACSSSPAQNFLCRCCLDMAFCTSLTTGDPPKRGASGFRGIQVPEL